MERESYLPAQLSTTDEGTLTATPLKWGGSSDFVGFVRATALIIVPANTREVVAGSRLKICICRNNQAFIGRGFTPGSSPLFGVR